MRSTWVRPLTATRTVATPLTRPNHCTLCSQRLVAATPPHYYPHLQHHLTKLLSSRPRISPNHPVTPRHTLASSDHSSGIVNCSYNSHATLYYSTPLSSTRQSPLTTTTIPFTTCPTFWERNTPPNLPHNTDAPSRSQHTASSTHSSVFCTIISELF